MAESETEDSIGFVDGAVGFDAEMVFGHSPPAKQAGFTEIAQRIAEIAASGDPRLAWIITDLMRFTSAPWLSSALSDAASALLGKEFANQHNWGIITDHMMAWEIPAPPNYL